MPDALDHRRTSAIAAVETWLVERTSSVQRLEAGDLVHFRGSPIAGWRVSADFADGERRVDIVVDAAFPFRPAKLLLVDRPAFGVWPHVERDGFLCLTSEQAAFSSEDPIGGVAALFEMAFGLVRRCVTESCDAEFRAEFLSYWPGSAEVAGRAVLGLFEPDGGSRAIRAWWGKDLLLLADDDDAIHRWLRACYGDLRKRDLKTAAGALLWIGRPLTPSQFPKTGTDLLDLSDQREARSILDDAAATLPGALPVVLGMRADAGDAYAGLLIPQPGVARSKVAAGRGFRPSRIPPHVAARRYFGGSAGEAFIVERADPSWIHGRARDPRFATLRGSSVVLLGCGSVGAPVATTLAQAGVGKLILVDHDGLKAANLSRHPLGAASLCKPKARELALRIRRDLPHILVEAEVMDLQRLLLERPERLLEADLVISALGNWAAEAMLDEWHQGAVCPGPVVYGWTEAHACAGHAVAILHEGKRLRDGFDSTGKPKLEVTAWPNGPTIAHEPACGAVFQPYGPVELGFITSMVADLALDCLLGGVIASTHRIWACAERLLDGAGGVWSDEWTSLVDGRSEGGFLTKRLWAAPLGAEILPA